MTKAITPVVGAYRGEARWFHSFEAVLTVASSVAQGMRPSDQAGCGRAMMVLACVASIHTVVVLVARPFVSPLKNVTCMVVSMLTTAAAVCVVLGTRQPAEYGALVERGQWIAAVAGMVSAAGTAVFVARRVMITLTPKKQQRRRRRNVSTDDDDADDDDTQALLDVPMVASSTGPAVMGAGDAAAAAAPERAPPVDNGGLLPLSASREARDSAPTNTTAKVNPLNRRPPSQSVEL